jgi:hypothetical protein
MVKIIVLNFKPVLNLLIVLHCDLTNAENILSCEIAL